MDASATVLFGKTRRAVLALLFEQSDRAYYLRELARLTAISPGSLHHELAQLESAGLISLTRDGNRASYQANPEHPIFEELQAIVHKTCGLPVLLQSVLAPLAGKISFAAIYGSYAKGTSHARSDVDVLIVGSLGLTEASAAILPLEEKIGREINVRVFSRTEYTRRGAHGDAFIRSVAAGPLLFVVGSAVDA